MKMTSLEKRFVNSEKKARENVSRITAQLGKVENAVINDVLEIGCGMGTTASFLAENYRMNVTGIDVDPLQVELAQKHYPESERLHYQVGDATHLAFEDSSFDLVISQDVFHHIPNWERAVSEISRVLRPGGILIWMDLTMARVFKLLKPFVRNYGIYTLDDVREAFRSNLLAELSHRKLFQGGMVSHRLTLRRLP